MDIYTMEQWRHDRTFKARPGQEITEEIYDEMLNCMPPKDLPKEKALQALREYSVPVHAGFLMGEPHSSGPAGELYLAFGSNDYGHGRHFFYLGLSQAARRIADGNYYFMDCMNAFVNNGLFPEKDFKSDADAIQKAADYEATLYKYTYKDGIRTDSRKLYEPRFL